MRKCLIRLFLFLLLSAVVGAGGYFLYFNQGNTSNSVKIFVTYHKPYQVPVKGNIVQPIQVGRAIEKEPFVGKAMLVE